MEFIETAEKRPAVTAITLREHVPGTETVKTVQIVSKPTGIAPRYHDDQSNYTM